MNTRLNKIFLKIPQVILCGFVFAVSSNSYAFAAQQNYAQRADVKVFIDEMVEQHGSPLLVLDCAVLEQQLTTLRNALPNVDLYYAIKSLPHPAAIQTLNQLGASFDIAG